MRRFLVIVLSQHRFEARALTVAAGILVGCAVALTVAVASLEIEPCLRSGLSDARCISAGDAWALLQILAMVVGYGAVGIVSFLSLALGVQLVAKELEHRTALLAWTLAPSRSRWFTERAAIMGVLAVGLAAAIGLALDLLQSVSYPLTPLAASLAGFQARGWMLVVYAAISFGVGALWGAVIGRGLPAMIVALLSASALLGGMLATGDALAKANPVAIEGRDLGALVADYGFEDVLSGRLLSFEEAVAIVPQTDPGFSDRFVPVRIGVPGERSVVLVAAYLATGVGSGFMLLIAAGAVVARRRTA